MFLDKERGTFPQNTCTLPLFQGVGNAQNAEALFFLIVESFFEENGHRERTGKTSSEFNSVSLNKDLLE